MFIVQFYSCPSRAAQFVSLMNCLIYLAAVSDILSSSLGHTVGAFHLIVLISQKPTFFFWIYSFLNCLVFCYIVVLFIFHVQDFWCKINSNLFLLHFSTHFRNLKIGFKINIYLHFFISSLAYLWANPLTFGLERCVVKTQIRLWVQGKEMSFLCRVSLRNTIQSFVI